MKQAFWTDAAGVAHKVTIVEEKVSTATIEYFDNSPGKRGVTYKAGRKYSHGTRVRVVVYKTELRPC